MRLQIDKPRVTRLTERISMLSLVLMAGELLASNESLPSPGRNTVDEPTTRDGSRLSSKETNIRYSHYLRQP
ncbi:MAG: hypothetical protein ABL921_21775 [Pirellula sp.]